MAQKLLNNGDAEAALDAAKEEVEKAIKKKDQKGQVKAMSDQIDALVALNKGDDAVALSVEAVALAKKTGNTGLECGALNSSVGAHLLKDAHTTALKAANNALALAQQSGEKEGEANAWLAIARIHLSKDDGDQGALLDVLQAAEKATDIFKSEKDSEGEAGARGVIASAQMKLMNTDEAVQAATHSHKLWKDSDCGKKTNDALSLLVSAYAANGNPREGMRVARKELEEQEGSKDRKRLAGATLVVSSACLAVEDAAESFKCAKQARAIYRTLDDKTGEAWATCAVGEAQRGQQRKLEAMKSAEEAMALFKEVGDAEGILAVNTLLSEVYLSIGKGNKAPDRKKLLAVLRDLNKAVENRDVEGFNRAKNKAETMSRFLEEYDTMDALAPAFDKDAQGTAEFLREQGWEVDESGGDGEKKAQFMKHFDHQSLYAYFRTVGGMGFGPQFRSTHPFRVGTPGVDATALSASCLPETEDWEMKMGFRPGVIDSGLQVLAVNGFP